MFTRFPTTLRTYPLTNAATYVLVSFMSAAATSPASPNQPAADPSTRAGVLLALVRRLIDYGRELAATLQQRSAATDLSAVRLAFGTDHVALILARILRGLHRAAALEERIVRIAPRLDAAPAPRAPAAREPRTAVPRARAAAAPDDPLAGLPTPEQIAAEVRRRPIGAVMADICRDLGILPSHPLWQDLQLAIIRYGGNLARLVMDICDRVWPLPAAPGRFAAAPAAAATVAWPVPPGPSPAPAHPP